MDQLDLIELCEDMCKIALSLVDDAAKKSAVVTPQIVLEKVANYQVPDPVIESVVTALEARGMVIEGGREKLAAALRDPAELAATTIELAQLLRPSSETGIPASYTSLPTKSAAHQAPISDEEAEAQEWSAMARSGEL